MKTVEEVKQALCDLGAEDAVVFDGDTHYADACIGVDVNNQRAVYDYDKMIDFLVDELEMSHDEAVEWIDYNTIRALPYAGEHAPIIMQRFED